MQRTDWILREIERLGAVLARLRDRVLGRAIDPEQLRQELSAAAASIGLDLELARDVTPATLLMLAPPEANPTRCWLFAESFFLEGLAAVHAGDAELAADLLLRARLLYEALDGSSAAGVALPDRLARIAEIDALLAS